ncbi:glycosyltransferase family 2 protein [Cyclobacterium plantarum]|uniref:Glycosyltransferase family 2 protein n=1 Tax=Cyclobacterium plantarum TaxID=2716263 RepID=A0ABX0H7B9_9BACT|nr:glycosyltransferase family 2 protein [Cyclobacterium plantarum]NHE56239.1 glycosyltransferase family 2 protein [Cyclobacterium plantarum]
MKKQANIFCVVVTCNGMKWLPKHIESIKNSFYPLKSVYVDNGSTDGTKEFLKNDFPEAILIELNNNLGFGNANNIGVKYAIENAADYVFLFNQDAYLEPETIGNCFRGFGLQKNIALVSPIHLNGDGSALDIGFQRCIVEELCPGFLSDLVLKKTREAYPIYSVNAAAWLLKTEIVNRIGLFSNAFFHYGEDINFQQRLKYFGFKALVVPDAFILHDREERNGEKSELGKKIEIKTNQMTILMDINESFTSTKKKVWKYAGLLLFEGKFLKSFSLVLDTYWNSNKYLKWREQMKKELSLQK